MSITCPRIMIASTHSGTGKTSLSLALIGALRRRGLRVQVFKTGPDFLDPGYHAIASGRPCYNLDGWMTGKDYVCRLFTRAAADADIAIIEGAMGLFDGADTATSEGSSAEIARWLNTPVLLIVNAHGVARSIAAMVKGFATFDCDLIISGVIANQCGSERHKAWLADSLQSAALPPLVGAIPRGAFPELPSRHLGLVTADSNVLPREMLDALADAAERHIAIDDVLSIARTASPIAISISELPEQERRVRVGAARDEAFHFYYPDTFDEMQIRGCEIVWFSPIHDARLPEDIDALYIGGGYPEAHVEALSANKVMMESIRLFARTGRPVYAECGGLMYLSQGLEDYDGKRHLLVGLLPSWTRMREKKQALGYVEVKLREDSLWGMHGDALKGHEFHYSELIENQADISTWKPVYDLKRRRSDAITLEGFQCGNILASYAHIHYGSRPGAIESFISKCETAKLSTGSKQGVEL
ncbi:MAG: cobyrinate a,c-diamide synthase [Armatimonadota bacterium]